MKIILIIALIAISLSAGAQVSTHLHHPLFDSAYVHGKVLGTSDKKRLGIIEGVVTGKVQSGFRGVCKFYYHVDGIKENVDSVSHIHRDMCDLYEIGDTIEIKKRDNWGKNGN